MMALQDLLAAIEAESATEAARLRAGHAAAAEAILAAAREQAAELSAAELAAADREERQSGELRLAAARDAASARIRQTYEVAYQRIARGIRDQLGSIRHRADYPEILAALITEARTALPGATVLRVDPADEPLARRLLAGESALRIEPVLACAGGAAVGDDAGATVRNTVEERLAAAESSLRALVGALLTEDEPAVSGPAVVCA
jgi:V/A-type H+-transporting ATPase subunit E